MSQKVSEPDSQTFEEEESFREKVILAVQKRPCLWDTNNKHYKNTTIKAYNWEKVAVKCGLTKDEATKVKTEWRSAIQCRNRALRKKASGAAGGKKKSKDGPGASTSEESELPTSNAFVQMLSFLDKKEEHRCAATNVPELPSQEENSEDTADVAAGALTDSENAEETQSPTKKKKKRTHKPEESKKSPKKKRKSNSPRIEKQDELNMREALKAIGVEGEDVDTYLVSSPEIERKNEEKKKKKIQASPKRKRGEEEVQAKLDQACQSFDKYTTYLMSQNDSTTTMSSFAKSIGEQVDELLKGKDNRNKHYIKTKLMETLYELESSFAEIAN